MGRGPEAASALPAVPTPRRAGRREPSAARSRAVTSGAPPPRRPHRSVLKGFPAGRRGVGAAAPLQVGKARLAAGKGLGPGRAGGRPRSRTPTPAGARGRVDASLKHRNGSDFQGKDRRPGPSLPPGVLAGPKSHNLAARIACPAGVVFPSDQLFLGEEMEWGWGRPRRTGG